MLLDSKIYSVTIYNDRALVKRHSLVSLNEGEHQLIFENLPLSIDENTVQVSGSEGLILYDVKLKKNYHKEIPDEKKKILVDEKKEIEVLIAEINDNISNTNKEKDFLQNIAQKTAESPKKSMLSFLVSEKLTEMLDYYRKRLDYLDSEIRNFNYEYIKLEERLKKIEIELKNFNQNQLKTKNQVELRIYVPKKAELNISFSYIVFGASWRPAYDLRADTETKKIKISYDAVIQQNTGEEWNDTELKLSTAKPHISAIKPDLPPWYLSFHVPVADVYMAEENNEEIDYKSKKRSASPSPKIMASGKEGFGSMNLLEKPVAKVESGATSVIFAIPGINSIIDNNQEHKVGITSFIFDAEFQYITVPKISPFAYLTIKVKNNSDYPLLSGKANIFLDNNYVTNTNLQLVSPQEEFQSSLGIDEGISVEQKLINILGKDEGIFSKKNKITHEYKIILKNNKTNSIKIKIQDQIPISQHIDIKIELLNPKYKEDTNELKINELKVIEWNYEIEAGKIIEIPLKFSIEYPRNEIINGI